MARSPGDLRRDDSEQAREQFAERRIGERLRKRDAPLRSNGRDRTKDECGAPPDVAVARLPPGSDEDSGYDREQRCPGRVVMVEAERNECRDEQNPSADAEHPCEDARGETEDDGEQIRHLTKSQTATARMNAAKSNSIVRVWILCCSAVAPATDTAAGSPTRAAYVTRTSP